MRINTTCRPARKLALGQETSRALFLDRDCATASRTACCATMRQTFEVLYFAWLTVLPLPESLALSSAIPHSLQLATQKRT